MTPLSTLIERAWPVFREAARMGRTLTYTELAGRVGPPLNRRQVHRQLLVPMSALCRAELLPDLSALVVRKDRGRPGAGWWAAASGGEPGAAWAEALVACWNHGWPARPPEGLLAAARATDAASEPTPRRRRILS